MRNVLNISGAILLLFNGIGALFGGWHLIFHPDGSTIDLSPDWLRNTPFHSYLIPGIVLFIINGLFSIFVFSMLLLKVRIYSWLVVTQGTILLAWILIQMFLMESLHFLQIIWGSIGVALIIIGRVLVHINNKIMYKR